MTAGRRGWGAPVGLSLVAAAFSVVHPGLLMFVPLALLLVAMPPRRPGHLAVAVFLLVAGVLGRQGDAVWWFARGWAFMLGAWFLVALALLEESSFTARALSAVAGTTVSAALMFLIGRSGWQQLDWAMGQRLKDGAASVAALWGPGEGTRAWTQDAVTAMNRAAEVQAVVYPALLGLASLAALGVAWWVWRRLTASEVTAFSPLREFRFRDELVWLLVAAVVALVLPLNGAVTRTGANIATFMGALYALRGLAVMVALFGAPGPFGALLGGMLLVFLFPMVLATTLLVGLTDSWLDLRARARQASAGHKGA